MVEYSYDKILEYIIQVSISDEACEDNLQSSFKKEVMLSARNGVDASILHLFAICNVVKMPVNSIYPKAVNPGVNRDVHNQMLFPLGQIYYPENLDGMISLLWTHCSNTNLRGWRPNHFVPCFQDIFDVSSSFALPYTSCTEKKEVTIPLSQSKTFVECDNSNSTSNKVNDELMDMADMFTTDKTEKIKLSLLQF